MRPPIRFCILVTRDPGQHGWQVKHAGRSRNALKLIRRRRRARQRRIPAIAKANNANAITVGQPIGNEVGNTVIYFRLLIPPLSVAAGRERAGASITCCIKIQRCHHTGRADETPIPVIMKFR